MTPDPGWYPDPHDRSRTRYWDGAAWTDRTGELAAEPTAPATRSRPSWPLLGAAAAALLALVFAGLAVGGVIGGDDAPEQIATEVIGQESAAGGGSADEPAGGDGGAAGPDEEPPGGSGGDSTQQVSTGAFTFELPAEGWSTISREAPAGDPPGSFRRTELRSPDNRYTLVVDRTPGGATDPAANAAAVEEVLSGTAGYRRLRWEAAELGGRPGWEWGFVQTEDGVRVEKTDLFFNVGSDGYAVLVTMDLDAGGDPEVGRETALHVADTLSPR